MSSIQPEAGIWYGACWLVVITRLISRRLHRGSWKRLQLDDYLIMVAMATDTVLMICMDKVVQTNSNLIAPGDDVSRFSQTEIDNRIFGSKLVLVIEQMQILTIWLVKACLLIMYNRMTHVLPQHKIVIVTAVYVAITFVVMEVLYFGVWCRPFNQYWAVPPNSRQCSAATNHLITNAVFNISSDLIIICIPMPLLFKVRLPKKNKAVLITVFLIGAFTIVAAVLNKYYSFTNPFGSEWTVWYLRESYTAILCANLPLIYPLIQRIFRLKNWSHRTGTIDGEYHQQDSQQAPTINSERAIWSNTKPPPVHVNAGGSLRGTRSQEAMDSAFDGPRDNGPHFITSAIDLKDLSLPPTPTTPTTNGVRSSIASSSVTPVDWRPGEGNTKGADPYRAK